jgi:hypothetical protein
MKLLPYIFILMLLVGCAAPRHVDANAPLIDTTSLLTMSASIGAGKPEDREVVGGIPCEVAHENGLDFSDPKARNLLLEKLRVLFHGKTVAQVADEVRSQRKAGSDQLQRFADNYVHERQVKWGSRAGNIPLIVLGTRRETLVKYLGNPDAKSDSDTVQNWLYHVGARCEDEQIWVDLIIIQMTGGTVSKITLNTDHQRIVDLYSAAQHKGNELISTLK